MTPPPPPVECRGFKVAVIEGSLACFGAGVTSLIPVLGGPFGVWAIAKFAQVRRLRGPEWNPARNYLVAGAVCGWLGVVITLATVAWIAIAVATSRDDALF